MTKLAQYLAAEEIRQTDFAKRCKITQASVSRLANGSAQPSPHMAKRIEVETGGAVRFYDWPAFSDFAPDANAEAS